MSEQSDFSEKRQHKRLKAPNSVTAKINDEEISQLKVLLELEHERLSGAEIKLTEVKLALAQAEIELSEVTANTDEKVKVLEGQKAKLDKLIAEQTAGDTTITVQQIDAQTKNVTTADAQAKVALEAQKTETAKVVTINTQIQEQVANIEGHKAEILRLETEIKSKEAEALELEAEIQTENENLEAAKKAVEEAEAALAVATEDLTNKDKVSTLEDENKEQK
ncbi:MAG: hypothetical protein HOG95_13970, partial [Rhodospirillaceae bacterium]|nr:hypothetical protein [Rhodospirillaceae bacterium]